MCVCVCVCFKWLLVKFCQTKSNKSNEAVELVLFGTVYAVQSSSLMTWDMLDDSLR